MDDLQKNILKNLYKNEIYIKSSAEAVADSDAPQGYVDILNELTNELNEMVDVFKDVEVGGQELVAANISGALFFTDMAREMEKYNAESKGEINEQISKISETIKDFVKEINTLGIPFIDRNSYKEIFNNIFNVKNKYDVKTIYPLISGEKDKNERKALDFIIENEKTTNFRLDQYNKSFPFLINITGFTLAEIIFFRYFLLPREQRKEFKKTLAYFFKFINETFEKKAKVRAEGEGQIGLLPDIQKIFKTQKTENIPDISLIDNYLSNGNFDNFSKYLGVLNKDIIYGSDEYQIGPVLKGSFTISGNVFDFTKIIAINNLYNFCKTLFDVINNKPSFNIEVLKSTDEIEGNDLNILKSYLKELETKGKKEAYKPLYKTFSLLDLCVGCKLVITKTIEKEETGSENDIAKSLTEFMHAYDGQGKRFFDKILSDARDYKWICKWDGKNFNVTKK